MGKTLTNYNLLIVSDLHLSEGRNVKNRKFSTIEDFFFDEEFVRFLAYYQNIRRWDGAKWHIIINGDFLDFLQVITADDVESADGIGSDQKERGLPCGEQETVRKLKIITKGHRLFFESLAGFVATGNLLTIIKGNHDVEFHYQGVRSAFLEELKLAFKRRVELDPNWEKNKNLNYIGPHTIRFSDWFYFEPDLIWVEHGNRYEGFNSFKYWLSPLLPEWLTHERKDEIDLPFGSLFVRYLFNRIEDVEPFADNIKPAIRYVFWLIKKHPIIALSFVFKKDGRFMLRRVCRAWADVPPMAWEVRKQQHNSRLGELARHWGIEHSKLEELDRLRVRSVLKEPNHQDKCFRFILCSRMFYIGILGAGAIILANMVPDFVWKNLIDPFVNIVSLFPAWIVKLAALAVLLIFLRYLRSLIEGVKKGPGYLKNRAAFISNILGVQYVVMGHTHEPELYTLEADCSRRKEYFNTGTWTTVFGKEWELIRKPDEFVFLQGIRTGDGLTMKLLEWNDAVGEPRLLKLFRDKEETEN